MGTDALVETTNQCCVSPLGYIVMGIILIIVVLAFCGVFNEPPDGLPSYSDRKH